MGLRLKALLDEQVPLVRLQIFHVVYCLLIVIQFSYNFLGQSQFLSLQLASHERHLVLGVLQLPRLDSTAFFLVGLLFAACLVLSTLGWRPPIFLFAAAALYFLYFSQIFELSYVNRKTNLIPLTLLLLAVTPGIERSGVRPLLRWLKGLPAALRGSAGPEPERVPGWPYRLYMLMISFVYLGAGISKLANGGLAWASGHGFQTYLFQNYLWNDEAITRAVAETPLLVAAMAVATFIFELGFWIVAFLPQRWWGAFVVVGVGFHIGTGVLMSIQYWKYFLPSYAVFITPGAVEVVYRGIAAWLHPAQKSPRALQ